MIKTTVMALALMAGAATAQEIDCTNAETQQEMNACAEQDWMEADADLNTAYAEAIAIMQLYDEDLPKSEKGAEANLRAAQRAWVTFRDAACAAEGWAMHGGSAEPLLIYGCRARLTQQRAVELRMLAEY